MKVKHTTTEGYSITSTYRVGLVEHEQVDYYDHDGMWLRTKVTMGESNE